jgi:glycosyltransferase involved in cell wall biosynthesis
MNVLYLIDSLTHGGTERQLAELILHLDQARIRPHLCTLKPSEGVYDSLSLPKQCLNFSSFAHPSLLSVLRQLSSFIRHHRIHLVQTFFQDPCLLGALIKPFTGVKLVGSFRDLGFWRTAAESRKMRLACPLFDGFIANSQAVKEYFCAMDRISPQKIEVIYNGFDHTSIPAGIEGSFEHSGPTIGIVANLNRPVKRVQDFISAAALVHRQRPEVKFFVVGGGHLQADLARQAASLGLAEVMTFTGRVPNPLDFIVRFSIGVITSETEGFCNALIEYMACGLPVIATRAGGNVEMVQEGENGFLYDVGAIEQLSGVIMRLLDDEASRNRMSLRNREEVRDRFTVDAMVCHTSEYYERLMSGAPV